MADTNLLVAAGVFALIGLLIVRYAIKLGGFFLIVALVVFLIAFANENLLTKSVPPENEVAEIDTSDITTPDYVKIGYPPRRIPLKKD